MVILKKDITDTAGLLYISSIQGVGAEVAIHAMRNIFANEDTEPVFLTEAENALNYINRKVMLHNLNFPCAIVIAYITTAGSLVGFKYYLKKRQLRVIQQLWGRTH